MNIYLRLNNAAPGKLLKSFETWVKKYRALRNKEEQETDIIIFNTDYLEAMDQWIAMLNNHKALKINNKDKAEALR
jgi:hypothetical protein